MLTAAVLQSNYIPWRGYFDLIHDVDVFVFYDDVQYTVNDWRNRNRVKTANGVVWLTIPVGNQNDRRICDVEIKDRAWARKHWMTIEQSYRRAPHFARYEAFFRGIYEREWTSLSELNQSVVKSISADLLSITTRFRDSREFVLQHAKSDRLLSLLQQLGASRYISGPAAKAYLDVDAYAKAGIVVEWKDYSTYPQYAQLHGDFEGDVSIIDTLMCCGDRAADVIWGYRGAQRARA